MKKIIILVLVIVILVVLAVSAYVYDKGILDEMTIKLGILITQIVLAGITGIYVGLVSWQTKGIKELTLKQIRYQVEGDITQIRLKRAEFLHKEGKKTPDGQSPMEILRRRECQCTKTVDRIVEELRRLGINS
jgi:hypothetical protein